jgi:hypothetical protein
MSSEIVSQRGGQTCRSLDTPYARGHSWSSDATPSRSPRGVDHSHLPRLPERAILSRSSNHDAPPAPTVVIAPLTVPRSSG